ncbi:hypothetical protein [Salinibius halmophilus]|uniref:hypothetical protein n=1 Tax=Salinibius halmophilus TaxID=1853216 RepID=UPI000E66BAA9|nr:hypothetical protein [Salinibius halmophilus]
MKKLTWFFTLAVLLQGCAQDQSPTNASGSGTPPQTECTSQANYSNTQTSKFGHYVVTSDYQCNNANTIVVRELPATLAKDSQGIDYNSDLRIDRFYTVAKAPDFQYAEVFVETTNTSKAPICPRFDIELFGPAGKLVADGFAIEPVLASFDYWYYGWVCVGPGESALFHGGMVISEETVERATLTPSFWQAPTHKPANYKLTSIALADNTLRVDFSLNHTTFAQSNHPRVLIQNADGYFVASSISANHERTRVYLKSEAHYYASSSALSKLSQGDRIYISPDLIPIELRGAQPSFVQQ